MCKSGELPCPSALQVSTQHRCLWHTHCALPCLSMLPIRQWEREQHSLKRCFIESCPLKAQKMCESIQHVQKNVSFAHPGRNFLPLWRCACTECKHEKRTGKEPFKGEDQQISTIFVVCSFPPESIEDLESHHPSQTKGAETEDGTVLFCKANIQGHHMNALCTQLALLFLFSLWW